MAKIGIIGAGLSGLILGQCLRGQGHDCHIFEKSRGLGGRLSRRSTPWAELDIGAPFLTPTHQVTQGFLDHFCDQNWLGKRLIHSLIFKRGKLQAGPDVLAYSAAGSNNQLCHQLLEGLSIHRQQRIHKIEYHQQHLRLYSESVNQPAQAIDFDAAALTAPAAQSIALLPATSPLRQQALPQMRPNWTISLQFSAAVAIFEAVGLIDFVDHPQLRRMVDLSNLPQRNHQHCYQVSLTPTFCEEAKTSDDSALIKDVLERLGQLIDLPAVKNSSVQRWNLAEHSLSEPIANIADPEHRLVLAGDWTSGKNIDGVLKSVGRAERALLAMLAN